MPRRKRSKKLADIFSDKKSKNSLSGAFSRGNKGSLSSIFSSKKRKGKKEKSLFDSIMGKEKKRRKDRFSISGSGGGFGGLFSGIFGGHSYVKISDDPSYENMRAFLNSHDMGNSRDGMLYYLMHLDGREQVRRVISEAAGRGFRMNENANWAYQQWEKYQGSPVFREVIGHMGHAGQDQKSLDAWLLAYFGHGVPKGIFYYVQDTYEKAKKILSKANPE